MVLFASERSISVQFYRSTRASNRLLRLKHSSAALLPVLAEQTDVERAGRF
jgi:hypothetical protein